jgi:hypothetical protein
VKHCVETLIRFRQGRAFLSLALASALASCAAVPTPNTIGPDQYAELGVSPKDFSCVLREPCVAPAGNINDVDDLYFLASRYAPSMLEARNDIARAFDGLASAQRSRLFTPALSVSADTNVGVTPAVSIRQPVWRGGGQRLRVERARLEASRTVAAYDVVQFETLLRLAERYQRLEEIDRLIEVNTEALEEMRALLDVVTQRVEQQLEDSSSQSDITSDVAAIENDLTELVLDRRDVLDLLSEDVGAILILDTILQESRSGREAQASLTQLQNRRSAGARSIFEAYAGQNLQVFELEREVDDASSSPIVDFVVKWDFASTPVVGLNVQSNFDPAFYDPARRYPTIRSLADATERLTEATRLSDLRISSLVDEHQNLMSLQATLQSRLVSLEEVLTVQKERVALNGGNIKSVATATQSYFDARRQLARIEVRLNSVWLRSRILNRALSGDTD